MATATPLLDQVIAGLINAEHSALPDRRACLIHIRNIHDVNSGLYQYAKQKGVLDKDGSCTELNIQFYTAYNAEVEHRY
jgi:hypothetical protein